MNPKHSAFLRFVEITRHVTSGIGLGESSGPIISLGVRLVKAVTNSALVASVDLLLAAAVFLSFLHPRFGDGGLNLVGVTVCVLIFVGISLLETYGIPVAG